MKNFIKIFKVPLIIFAVVWIAGMISKSIVVNRPKVEFVRNNTECTTDERVFDYADKLTDEEEDSLRMAIEAAELRCGLDIIVVTLDETLEDYAKSYEPYIGHVEPYQYTMVFADNFYDENSFGFNKPHGDGVILVDNWYRESDGSVYSWMSTSGKAIEGFEDDRIEEILSWSLDSVEDDPAYAYEYFVDLVADDMDPNYSSAAGMGPVSAFIGLIAGLIFKFVNRGSKKGKNTVESKAYVKNHQANIVSQQDIFITKTTKRRKIDTDSSGGSSRHTSAGGHSHGGGGHSR